MRWRCLLLVSLTLGCSDSGDDTGASSGAGGLAGAASHGGGGQGGHPAGAAGQGGRAGGGTSGTSGGGTSGTSGGGAAGTSGGGAAGTSGGGGTASGQAGGGQGGVAGGGAAGSAGQAPAADIAGLPALDAPATPGVAAPGDPFSSNAAAAPAPGGPRAAEWTRTALPDDHVVVAADDLTDATPTFRVYDGHAVHEASVEVGVDSGGSRAATVLLPSSLGAFGTYAVWPSSGAGRGRPFLVNRTEAFWVQDEAAPGQSIALHGRNLAHGGGPSADGAHVYIRPAGGGAGLYAAVTEVSPYRVVFTVPSGLAPGAHEVWAHNGHGGDWGWSEPLPLSVVASSVVSDAWPGPTRDARVDHGALADGKTDDAGAINAAIKAAAGSGGTVRLPAGTYALGEALTLASGVRLLGDVGADGKPTTVLRLLPGFKAGPWGLTGGNSLERVSLANVRFEANGVAPGAESLLGFYSPHMLELNNCAIVAPGVQPLRLVGARHAYLTGSEFIGREIYLGGGRQLFVRASTFRMTSDCDAALVNQGVREVSVTDSTFRDLDHSDPSSGAGWGKGRIWSALGHGGSSFHGYFAGNHGEGLGVRPSGTDPNSGEIFLWEANATTFRGSPASASAQGVVFAGPVPPASEPQARHLVVVRGRGAGQFRRVTVNAGDGQLTVDRPWQVVPDASSLLMFGPFVEKMVIYGNTLDAQGKPYIAGNGTFEGNASTGVNFYGGCVDVVFEGNALSGTRAGMTNYPTQHASDTIDPNFWSLFQNNQATGARYGIQNVGVSDDPQRTFPSTALLGAVYRRNDLQGSLDTDCAYYLPRDRPYPEPSIRGIVFEHSHMSETCRNHARAIFGAPVIDVVPGTVGSQVFYDNQ